MTKIRLIISILVVTLLFGTVSLVGVGAKDVIAEPANCPYKYNYKTQVAQKLDFDIYNYGEVYEYYATPDESTSDEVTPDYVLLVASTNSLGPYVHGEVFGEYYVRQAGDWYPYGLALYIYLPKVDEIYTLREAYDMNLEGLEAVFTDFELGALGGDVTGDRKLSVKDATEIQKRIAGLSDSYRLDPFEEVYDTYSSANWWQLSLSDFNRDGETNIQDATAIQKAVAEIN